MALPPSSSATPPPVYGNQRAPGTVYHGEATMFAPTKPTPVVPDVNPAAEAVKRLRARIGGYAADPARQLVNRDYTGAKNPELLEARIVQLEQDLADLATVAGQVCGILYSLNNATIECNEEDSTITLTFPDLPAEC